MSVEKKSQRAYYRAQLKELKSEEKISSSKKLILHLTSYLEANPKIKTVGLFAGTRTEPYLLPLLETFFVERLAPQFYLPKITDVEQCLMHFEQVKKQRELVKGAFDILEPNSGVIAKHLDLILVPGLAFTKDGGRLGQGGGYYDRYLDKYPYTYTLGMGFHCQLADYLSIDSHDILLDSVLLK